MPPITISFTTTPDRLSLIRPMIQSLKEQTYTHFTLVLWLCPYYERSKITFTHKEIPSFLKNDPFVSIEFCKDYGSNTKLYPLLQAIKDPHAVLITVDDDTLYPPTWLEGLIEASQHSPMQAYGYRGKLLHRKKIKLPYSSFAWDRPLKYKNSQTVILSPGQPNQSVDLLTGVWGILYRRSFFKDAYFNLQACPAARHNDDLWANGHLARNNITRVCIPSKEPFIDIPMEKNGVKRLWDSVNNGKRLNNKVLAYFKYDLKK